MSAYFHIPTIFEQQSFILLHNNNLGNISIREILFMHDVYPERSNHSNSTNVSFTLSNHNASGTKTTQDLVSSFLSNLQNSGFPSTMCTILSVSNKIGSNFLEGKNCNLCCCFFEESPESLCSHCISLLNEFTDEKKIVILEVICIMNSGLITND